MFYNVNNKYTQNEIKITDASGVSRFDLINAKTAVEMFKDYLNETNIADLMQTSSQGTLNSRLLFLKDNLKAKTGTMENFSSLLGTLKTSKNNKLIFCTIIQNSTKRKAVLKSFENDFITMLFRRY